ncbi:MAG: glycosyltransferase [Candidatus Moraniibacteriota bacterium]
METSQTPTISVIIRTKNEEAYLEDVLSAYACQSFKDFEIIAVDDHSVDRTLEIVESYGCRVITVPGGRFLHPYSCNLGAEAAKGAYLVFTNGHSIPASENFLLDGVNNFFDDRIAGVFSLPISHENGTFADKLIYDLPGYTVGSFRYRIGSLPRLFLGPKRNPLGISLLGSTNAILRKTLWQEYPFNESFNNGLGGEDADWAWHFVNIGYEIIHDPKFRVRHSHLLRIRDIFWQLQNWRHMVTAEKAPERQRKYF